MTKSIKFLGIDCDKCALVEMSIPNFKGPLSLHRAKLFERAYDHPGLGHPFTPSGLPHKDHYYLFFIFSQIMSYLVDTLTVIIHSKIRKLEN